MAPSVSVLGSFFPAWLVSIVLGLLLTVIVRWALAATHRTAWLRPAALAYPSLICLLTFATWLLLFES